MRSPSNDLKRVETRRFPNPAKRLWVPFCWLLFLVTPAQATYSIVARDPVSGQIGAAVQSHWFQVSNVIWVEAEVGAVATQSLADFTYGPLGLDLLRVGRSAKDALNGLLAADEGSHYRQVAILDADGDIANHTGARCIAEAGEASGEHYSVQANLMERDTVPNAMARAFEEAEGDLAERLLAALEAAQREGGDIRGKQSAALIVVGPRNTGRPWADRLFDVRVDDSREPLRELRRLVTLARAYASMNEGDLAIEHGDFDAAAKAYRSAERFAPNNPEVIFWYGISLVNAGRRDEAVATLSRVYEMDPIWRRLPERLALSGLLPNEPELIRALSTAGN